MGKKYTFILVFCLLIVLLSSAEESEMDFDWDFNIAMGVETFDKLDANGVPELDDNGFPVQITFSKLALSPDFSIGKFGIGLDLTIHYYFEDGTLHIRNEDWAPPVPERTFSNYLELYLAKFKYVRWDKKGAPLYIKFGAIEDGRLGNGFIVNNYSNTLYLPEQRIFGLSFDFDGSLFDFPLVGIETHVGNVVDWDVIGARVFVRPLYLLEIPIIRNLELGVTFVGDIKPFAFLKDDDAFFTDNSIDPAAEHNVFYVGGDFQLPILSSPIFAIMALGDIAAGKNNSIGGAVGFAGSLITIFNYGLQLRLIGDGFIPNYFDATYDLERPMKYVALENAGATDSEFIGWLGTLGTSLFKGLINLNFVLDGPFQPIDDDLTNYLNYLHLVGSFSIEENLIPGLSFEASYDKKFIRNFEEIFNFEGAMLYAKINYQTGPAIISLFYQMKYENGSWDAENNITSGLESIITLN